MVKMQRIYEPVAYGDDPIKECFWATSVPAPQYPPLDIDQDYDVAIIGAGFTGLSAAYELAKAGARVCVLEAEHPLFGATGRNGGFCCLGGAKASDAQIDRLVGKRGRLEYRQSEKAAVDLVAHRLDALGIDADVQPGGETELAHRAKDAAALRNEIPRIKENYGVAAVFHAQSELRQLGFGGPFYGGLTTPVGFGLNPRKYALGLLQAAERLGAKVYGQSPVTGIKPTRKGYGLQTPKARVRAEKVIIATNGYSSDDLPNWMRARYIPVQSSVIVTRPLTTPELQDQGYTSTRVAADSRQLLHYFRLLPDNRFLFGMRGGLFATPRHSASIAQQIRANFAEMFPAWRKAEIEYDWSGLICLTRNLTPFVGPIQEMPGVYAGFGYHGNGVAMGSYAGALLADLALGAQQKRLYPRLFQKPPRRFPLGRYRRHLLRPIYSLMAFQDR